MRCSPLVSKVLPCSSTGNDLAVDCLQIEELDRIHPKRVGKGEIARLTPKTSTKRRTEIRNNIQKDGKGISGSGDGWTLLHYFSSEGNALAVRLLLEKGADVGANSRDAGTALNCAAINGYEEIVRILLDQGAQTNTRDMFGRTPLIQASRWGHGNVVKVLLERGVDLTATDDEGKSAQDRAMECEWGTAKLLLDEAMKVRR
jgi:Ankyrin repeats (3 copies)/Ankyrin repeat